MAMDLVVSFNYFYVKKYVSNKKIRDTEYIGTNIGKRLFWASLYPNKQDFSTNNVEVLASQSYQLQKCAKN